LTAFAVAGVVLVAGAAGRLGALPQQSGPVDLLRRANIRIDGAAEGDLAGGSVAGAGDVNGDGRPDMVVGASFANNTRRGSGSAYVVFGQRASTVVDLAKLGGRGFRIDGADENDFAGEAVAGPGDVNGDGRADVLVGATQADNNDRQASGSAYVVFGKASTGTVDLAALGGRGFRIDGAADSDFAGDSVAGAGDVNGDGRADVLVGAQGADHNSRLDSGSIYVVFGQEGSAVVDLASLGGRGFRIDGAAADDGADSSVAGAGDVNADGRPDVLVGATQTDNHAREDSGSAYVVFGQRAPAVVDLAALGARGFRIDGARAHDWAGGSVAGAGDVNGDKRADVLVGAHFADNNARDLSGSAYVVFGKASTGTVDLAALGRRGFRIDGAAHDEAGSVAGAGDVNGDGPADVLVGALWADNNARADSGSAYVVFGKASTGTVDLAALGPRGFRIDGARSGDQAGGSVAGAGDVNRDGGADLLVGADHSDNNAREFSGSAYVVFGFKPETKPPTLRLAARSPQRVLRQKGVIVSASCDEACTLSASGRIWILGQKTGLRLRPASGKLGGRGRRALGLALSPAATRRLNRLLNEGKRAHATVAVRAVDRAGNTSTAKRTVAVRR
jgi:hypothetical protein